MLQLTLEEIARVSSGRLFHGNPQKKIKGVSIDSRTIKPQELFIPLKGGHTDGHKFLREVKKRNAAALVRKNFPQSYIPVGLPFIRVQSPLHALGDIANYHRQKFQLPVIAITGSCGKTTVKEMTARILACKFRVLKAEGNFNNEIGLPLTLLRLKKGDEAAILEMGMSSPGEIAYLTRISRPSIGVITNINPVHLEGCGNLDGVSKAKEELLLNLPEGAKAVLNYDDVRLRRMGCKFPGEVISFGTGKKAGVAWRGVRADGIRYKKGLMSFRLNGKERFDLPFLSRANLYNALAAIATASLFNISFARMRHALKSMRSLPQRLAMSEIHNLKIIDDTYNANPASYRVAIDALKSLEGRFGTPKGMASPRYIVVAGDMLELGDASSREHFNLGYYIAKMGIDFLVTIGKWGKKVREGAERGGLKKDHIFSVSSPEEAARIILNIAKPCDRILFKASRKIGLERALNVLSSSLSSL
ncbi:MAG: UDP-N-acetylmuramoyl-tripeptide--D-alanyl-D-alanine ligase [Candidatus Omnitrophica bacterium]|nr:UDP-N-acetylmuramoyl-tripeptide--D-alanyl-D-alanine ligase [Candidatus Omnitrophota bacterium]